MFILSLFGIAVRFSVGTLQRVLTILMLPHIQERSSGQYTELLLLRVGPL
nr:MAG TPA: hypothetical protein [Caudoviricetes sp.]